MVKIIANIDGMACSMCEAHVNDAIRKNLKVKKVKSSHRKGQTIIVSQEDIGEEDIKRALEGTGYEVKGVVVE